MTTQEWLPWNNYPGLTRERLIIVADIIRIARESAADDHKPEKGETNWSLGVRGFERTCFALTWASQGHSWLTVISGADGGPVHFVMNMGGHPFRFYRGEPDEVPDRYRQISLLEALEQERAHELDNHVPKGHCLRIVIENTDRGRPSNIYLLDMDEATGNILHVHLIPPVAKTTIVADFAPSIPPVDLPEVKAEPIESEEQTKNDQEEKKTGSDDE